MCEKPQNHFLKFSIHLSVKISGEKLQTNTHGKSKQHLEKFKHSNGPQNLLAKISFFRTAVLPKLFDIRFSYKHCNFSHVYLLVKMAWKTVTRSIVSVSKRQIINSTECPYSIFQNKNKWNKLQKSLFCFGSQCITMSRDLLEINIIKLINIVKLIQVGNNPPQSALIRQR